MGLSLENSEQYIGGSGGGGLVTLPAALATPYAKQLNDGTTKLSVPDAHPDVIAKLAFDPSSRAHLEVAGVFRTFRVYNPLDSNGTTLPTAMAGPPTSTSNSLKASGWSATTTGAMGAAAGSSDWLRM